MNKKVTKSLFILLLIILININFVYAHPGRTDKNGGHYVRKSGWGYPVGSYHYHNGGSSNSSSGSSSTSLFKMEIYQAQTYLNALDYNSGTPDGIMGTKTKDAIMKFQKDNGITANGILNVETQQLLLDKYLNKILNPTTSNKQPSSTVESKSNTETNPQNNDSQTKSPEIVNKNSSSRDIVTNSNEVDLGMTKQEVLRIMGAPKEFSMNSPIWFYEDSYIIFDYIGRVTGWKNTGNLKVHIYIPYNTGLLVDLGMTKQEVLRIMGAPKEFSMSSPIWFYEDSNITFDYIGRVTGWENTGNLKVHNYIPDNTGLLVDLGMTKQEVLRIMGAPKEFSMSSPIWFYEDSYIIFDYKGMVTGWDNNGELKTR